MSRVAAACCAGVLIMSALAARAAEDHSQHVHGAEPAHMPPKSDDAARHDLHDRHIEPSESERAHVPPDPPQHVMGDMSTREMVELMQMEDDAPYALVQLDQLEWRGGGDGEEAQALELQAYYGGDYQKAWLEAEVERVDSEVEGRIEALWDRIISPWWSVQTGVRHDLHEETSRTWGSIGVQGLAPYFFEIDAALYVGEQGRTAARLAVDYELLLTQRLVLQPELDVEAFGRDDRDNGLGSGLSSVEAGVRLRYEIRREFAPYVGVHWERRYGGTADFARAAGEDVSDGQLVIGVRAWF